MPGVKSCIVGEGRWAEGPRDRGTPRAEHGTAPVGAVGPGAPAPAPGAGVGEPGALRGARRAGPQFPRPVTRLASLPRRVAAAKRRLRSARRQGRCPIAAAIGPGSLMSRCTSFRGGTPAPSASRTASPSAALSAALRAGRLNITRRALCQTGAGVRVALRAVYQGLATPLAHAPAASPAVHVTFARELAPAPGGPRARLRRGRTSRQASRRPSAAAAESAGTASAYWRAYSCGARSFVAVLLAPRDAASSCQRGGEPPRRAAKKRSLAALFAERLLHRRARRQTTFATEAA